MIVKKEEVEAIEYDGLSIFDYTVRFKKASSFAVIEVPSGVSHQLSSSKKSDKFYYVIEGAVDFTVNGESSILNKGDFCIVKKGDKFEYRNGSNDTALLVLVHTPGFE